MRLSELNNTKKTQTVMRRVSAIGKAIENPSARACDLGISDRPAAAILHSLAEVIGRKPPRGSVSKSVMDMFGVTPLEISMARMYQLDRGMDLSVWALKTDPHIDDGYRLASAEGPSVQQPALPFMDSGSCDFIPDSILPLLEEVARWADSAGIDQVVLDSVSKQIRVSNAPRQTKWKAVLVGELRAVPTSEAAS